MPFAFRWHAFKKDKKKENEQKKRIVARVASRVKRAEQKKKNRKFPSPPFCHFDDYEKKNNKEEFPDIFHNLRFVSDVFRL